MMKYLSLVILICSCFSAISEEQPIHVYLCARLTEEAKGWNDLVTKELDQGFHLFRPQDVDLSHLPAEEFDHQAYQEDIEGMKKSDLLLILPPYGRDCAWEVGWFCGEGKVAVAYAEASGEWVRDTMVKGGLTAVVTTDPLLHKTLLNDRVTSNKCYLIDSRERLGETIRKIYHQTTQNK